MPDIEVFDPVATKIVGAVPVLGKGRPLTQREQEYIGWFVDPARPDSNAAAIAAQMGVLNHGIQIMVRFADGREAGVRLVPMKTT